MKWKFTSIFILSLLLVTACGTSENAAEIENTKEKDDAVEIDSTEQEVNKREIALEEKVEPKRENETEKKEDKQKEEEEKKQLEEEEQAEAKAKVEAQAKAEAEKKEKSQAKQEVEKEQSKPVEKLKVIGEGSVTVGLNLRQGASTNHGVITTIPAGAKVEIHNTENGWSQVSFGEQTGWASSQYINDGTKQQETETVAKPVEKEEKAEKIVQINAPYINQYSAGAPMGCEAAALLQGLHAKGQAKNYNLSSFLAEMPVAANGNPNEGFGGTPYSVIKGVYQSIFPQPLAAWGQKYGSVANISGSSVDALKKELDNGNPIVVYVTLDFKQPTYQEYDWGTGVFNAHVVTLTGYKDGSYHITDPAKGKYWVNAASFESSYNLKKFAVAVR